MTTTLAPLAGHGLVFSEAVLHTGWYGVLAAFVALNTIMYCALALAKVLPKVYVSDWFHHRNRRGQSRSIYPDGFTPDELAGSQEQTGRAA